MPEIKTLLTYVASEGLNPYTGEVYPDGVPRERSLSQIYNLLELGFTVEDRTDGRRIPLDKTNFFLTNINDIIGNGMPQREPLKREEKKEPVAEEPAIEINPFDNKNNKKPKN